MSPRVRKQPGKQFKELHNLNERDEKRLSDLGNYARYKATINNLLVNKDELEKDINVNEKYLGDLTKVPKDQQNGRLIYQTKKNIMVKEAQLKEIQKEIATLRKFTIRDKPENVVSSVKAILGPDSKVYTQMRSKFVTATVTRRTKVRVNDSDKFEATGRTFAKHDGFKSFHETLSVSVDSVKGLLRRINYRAVEFAEYKTIKPWETFARAQVLGKTTGKSLHDKVLMFGLILEQILKQAKPTEASINSLVNNITKGTGSIIFGELTFRYVIEKTIKEEVAIIEDGERKTRIRKKPRKFNYPGVKSVVIKINGGVD